MNSIKNQEKHNKFKKNLFYALHLNKTQTIIQVTGNNADNNNKEFIMTNNRETQRKALDKYFDLIKDKKNRRVAFRGYLTFFPRFFRKDKCPFI